MLPDCPQGKLDHSQCMESMIVCHKEFPIPIGYAELFVADNQAETRRLYGRWRSWVIEGIENGHMESLVMVNKKLK